MPVLLVVLVVLVCVVGGMVYLFVPDKFELARLLYPAVLAAVVGAVVGMRSGPSSAEVDTDTRERYVDRARRQQELRSLFSQPFVWLVMIMSVLMTLATFLI